MYDPRKAVVRVAERINGKRITRDIKPVFELYTPHINGIYETITGEMCNKHTFSSSKEMKAYKTSLMGSPIFESDINITFKTLANNYSTSDVPDPHVCFFDIEVEYNEETGYCTPSEAVNKVTMISYYCSWTDTLGAFVVKPHKTTSYSEMTQSEAELIVSRFDNVVLCETEYDMLDKFLHCIADADILTGWNSDYYDIPYLVNRVGIIMNSANTRRFCLWNQEPREVIKTVYDKPVQTYQLSGRVHLDYLDLYKKHTYSVLPSYKLDAIGESEVGEKKVEYDGTLHKLYNEDFEKFIKYGLKDSLLLYKIDQKKEFINLANQLAHQNTVLFPTTMGSVALIDNAIVNMAHSIGKLVFDKKVHPAKDKKAAGAWVADPHKGLQEFIGLVDLNSLYPSVIRSLNMSTETIVGQIRHTYTDRELDLRVEQQRAKSKSKNFEPDWAECWHGFFGTTEFNFIKDSDTENIMTVDMESGDSFEATGEQLKAMIFEPDSKFILSANGTIFRNDRDGIIPIILKTWYTERQNMQRAAIDFKHLTDMDEGIPEADMMEELNGQSRLEFIMEVSPNLQLEQRNGCFFALDIPEAKKQASYWKMMQQIRKILLNSLYGALLNEGSRFYDPRLGQSVTLTGRIITQHMGSKTNEILAGSYDHMGGVSVYGDTDSVMFSAKKAWDDVHKGLQGDPVMKKHIIDMYTGFEWTKDNVEQLYLMTADLVDDSFPKFMMDTCNTGYERGRIIAAGLEIIGTRGLFLKKKRYTILKYHEDGDRLDKNGKVGKLKNMGTELKRSDTPKPVQIFLEDLMMDLLTGVDESVMRTKVMLFKREFLKKPAWYKGMPRTIKGMFKYTEAFTDISDDYLDNAYTKGQKCAVGHAVASYNWNKLREINKDFASIKITDGDKITVCDLKDNQYRMKKVAYPTDQDKLPQWFKDLPFDSELMGTNVINKKLDNVFGIVDMDIGIYDSAEADIHSNDLFSGW